MKEIVSRLHENRQIQLAKEILESNGYKVSKTSKRVTNESNGYSEMPNAAKEDQVIKRVSNYLEDHPYEGTEDDVEDICVEICDNLFDMDYDDAPPYISHGVFTAVSNYIEEQNN